MEKKTFIGVLVATLAVVLGIVGGTFFGCMKGMLGMCHIIYGGGHYDKYMR